MENEQKKLVLLASEVMISEEEKLNPVFLSIEMKLADSAGNRNNEGITAAFISDLINRQEEFECLPFYADVKNLLARNYDNLGHMYNRVTRKFASTQIGSLTNFYSETDNDGVISLYATARVPKREQEICLRLAELYEQNKLNVSFEVRYNPDYTIEKDGVLYIDANEDNALTGIALVSVPACPDATALDMVASVADDSEEIVTEGEGPTAERGEQEPMEKETVTAEVTEEKVQEVSEDTAVAEEAVAEEGTAGDGAGGSEGGEGASESGESAGEGAGDSGSGAGESGSGSSGSESGGSGSAGTHPDDQDEEKRLNAEDQDTTAEVLEHAVDTHESVENWGGEPVHVIEYRERIIETMEDAGAVIAELVAQVAELEEIKGKYDAMIAEEEQKALAAKQEKAKAFAEKQGLDVNDTAVAEAIQALDYTKIAELTMAQVQEEPAQEEAQPAITLASFVELDISEDRYGGLLSRRNK